MLLLFMVDDDRYGMDIREVVEIIPYIPLNKLSQTPKYVAGIFNYRNHAVPVIDVSMLISGKPAKTYFSTRIVIVNYSLPNGGRSLLGLIAERATETIKADPSAFISSGLNLKGNEYLSSIMIDQKGMVHCMELSKLLPAEIVVGLYEAQSDSVLNEKACS